MKLNLKLLTLLGIASFGIYSNVALAYEPNYVKGCVYLPTEPFESMNFKTTWTSINFMIRPSTEVGQNESSVEFSVERAGITCSASIELEIGYNSAFDSKGSLLIAGTSPNSYTRSASSYIWFGKGLEAPNFWYTGPQNSTLCYSEGLCKVEPDKWHKMQDKQTLYFIYAPHGGLN